MHDRPDIDVRDTPFDPHAAKAVVSYRKREDGTILYKVYVRLVGADVPFVRTVSYHLHPTFSPRVQTVQQSPSNSDCTLELWMWGVFELTVEITDIDGDRHEISHYLEYDKFFEPGKFEEAKLELQRA